MKVEVYKLVNRLKQRMGVRFEKQESGFIDTKIIEEADRLIAEARETSPELIRKNLETLTSLWNEIKETPVSPERENAIQRIFTLAHEIKDLSTMCNYDLMAYFAESLRDYIGRTDLNIKAQIIITQAHVDALQIVHRKGYRKDAGPEAEELKRMVKMAIDKYQ